MKSISQNDLFAWWNEEVDDMIFNLVCRWKFDERFLIHGGRKNDLFSCKSCPRSKNFDLLENSGLVEISSSNRFQFLFNFFEVFRCSINLKIKCSSVPSTSEGRVMIPPLTVWRVRSWIMFLKLDYIKVIKQSHGKPFNFPPTFHTNSSCMQRK